MAPALHFPPRPQPLLTAAVLENQIIEQNLGIKSALTSQVFHLPDGSSGGRKRDEVDKPLP